MLLGNYSRTEQQIQGKNERSSLLVKGTLSEYDGKKKIRWNETNTVSVRAPGDSYLLAGLVGGGESGAVRMTLYCGVTWIAVLLRALCGGLFLSVPLPFCVWESCGRGCVRGSECGWLPAPPRALGTSIQVALLDGVARHPGRDKEEDEKGLLWAEGG
ncbi:putative trans-sialidase [Trypanosoma cruzi]|nr:putative trans-sialidase [Trypanosoma cruzi]